MEWIEDYDLFLFDFDGLLVNTEMLHFAAYKQMCLNRGFHLDWNFSKYIETAHYSSEGLENRIYNEFPDLKQIEGNWKVLYKEKKAALIDMYRNGPISLMPGAEELLRNILEHSKKIAVVTNSDSELVKIIRERNPLLDAIPNWITRELYTEAKPHPECYVKAIESLAEVNDVIIGFEDTPRGLRALLGSRARAVIITDMDYPEIPDFITAGVAHYKSFEDIPAAGPKPG